MVKVCMDLYGRIDLVDYNVGLAHLGGLVEAIGFLVPPITAVRTRERAI
jgi:hypothetical protein